MIIIRTGIEKSRQEIWNMSYTSVLNDIRDLLNGSENNKRMTVVKVTAEIVRNSVNVADLLHFIHYSKDK